MTTTELIQCKLIDVPKTPSSERSHSKEGVRKMAESIKDNGLLQSIGVVPKPEGRYLLVYGRHRLEAVRDVIKDETIEAKILHGYSTAETDMARIVENLHRSGLNKAQSLSAIRRYTELLMAKHPELVGRKAGGAQAQANRKRRKEEGDESKAHAGQCSASEIVTDGEPVAEIVTPEPNTGIPGMVAAHTGESLGSARRKVRIANNLTEEQITILESTGTTIDQMDRLACMKVESERSEAVNLVASGLDVVASIERAKSASTPAVDENGATVEPPKPTPESFNDSEWLEHFCHVLRSKLADTRPFDKSATFYRRTRDARSKFAQSVAKLIDANIAMPGSPGVYVGLVKRMVYCSHPKDWLLCGACNGGGTASGPVVGLTCRECSGGGFKIPQEAR